MAVKSDLITPQVVPLSDFFGDVEKPRFFANGFQCSFTMSDASVVFLYNSESVALLTLGLPVVKSLKNQLEQLLTIYEETTKEKVISVEEMMQKVQKNATSAQ